MFAKSVVAAAALLNFGLLAVVAQNTTLPFPASSISPGDRANWCEGEFNTCTALCKPGGTVDSKGVDQNQCDPATLVYSCLCASNSSTPGLEYYSTSMPSFICQQVYANCIVAAGDGAGSAAAKAKCLAAQTANCGTLDASKFVPPASSSSSAGPTATPTAAGSGTPSTTASSSSSSGAAATMLAIGGEYGAGMVAAGVAAAFGLML